MDAHTIVHLFARQVALFALVTAARADDVHVVAAVDKGGGQIGQELAGRGYVGPIKLIQ